MNNRKCAVPTLALVLAGAAAGLLSCRDEPAPPHSILLAVLDTTRLDAVSAYGQVMGTTPTIDALAADGLRYTRAYANASWTLPSHATIFTGLLPSQHGVDWTHMEARDSLVMLAERLQQAGYETLGISENPYMRASLNMTQGFERFVEIKESPEAIERALAEWRATWRGERPVFVFVNIMDAHQPYLVRETNPFLPGTTTTQIAQAVSQRRRHYLCAKTSRRRQFEVLRGLYHGDVAQADAKLAGVLRQLRDAGLASGLITMVVSDHGEHFGEHGLIFHDVGLREQLIHVPLVVHGLSQVEAAVIDSPIQLADVVPSVLSWAGLPVPDELPGRPFPTTLGSTLSARPIVSEHSNGRMPDSPDETPSPTAQFRLGVVRSWLKACGPDDRVFGEMRSLVRRPWKLIWYAEYPPQLYDLERDPLEKRDVAGDHPEILADLLGVLERTVSAAAAGTSTPRISNPLETEFLERLREIGYLE